MDDGLQDDYMNAIDQLLEKESQLKELRESYKKLLEFAHWSAEHASCHACEYQASLAKKVLIEIGESEK
jgi:hypothetical protein